MVDSRTTHSELGEIVAVLSSFRELKPNWDSYNALRVYERAISSAILFVQETQTREGHLPYTVAPTQDGGVSLKYETPQQKLDLIVRPDGTIGEDR